MKGPLHISPEEFEASTFASLFLFANAFERFVVSLSVHKSTGIGIPLYPGFGFGIKSLAPILYLPIPVSIAGFSILASIISFWLVSYLILMRFPI